MADESVLDVSFDTAGRRRRARRRFARIAVPAVGVLIIAAAILGIAFYAHDANQRGALGLSNDLLETLEQRVEGEVNAFLGPVDRAARIVRDVTVLPISSEPGRLVFERSATSVLQVLPQVALTGAGDAEGNYIFVRRLPEGGTETKTIVNAPAGRRVTLLRRDAAGMETGTTEDPDDAFDPRTRPWYRGAIEENGLFWTEVYVFFTARTPGLTASLPVVWQESTGAIGLDIELVALSRFLSGLRVGRSGRAMIIDPQGNLVAHPDPSRVLRQEGDRLVPVRLDELGDPVLTRAYDHLRLSSTVRRVEEIDGTRYIVLARELPSAGRGWRVVITAPEADFTGFVTASRQHVLVMSFGVVILAGLLGALLARQGLRADSAARQVLQRSRAVEAQSRAFAALAATAGLFDPDSEAAPRALTASLAEATGARRASIWRLLPGGVALRCVDAFEREANGHMAGIELHRREMPALFRRLAALDTIEVADAALEPTTAELHRFWMHGFGSRALLSVPVEMGREILGAVLLEDVPDANSAAAEFAHAVANMVALRLQGHRPAPTPAVVAEAAGVAEPARAGLSEGALLPFGTDDFAAEVLPGVAVMALRFTDPVAMARAATPGTPIADTIAGLLQEVATTHGLPYARLAGEVVCAAAGFTREEAGASAARRIAAAALDLRDRCEALFEEAGQPPAFRIGVDLGVAIGSSVGRGPRFFNLWGDAVRTADRLAETAPTGAIQASEPLYQALRRGFMFRPRGSFYLPRVGEMRSFILAGQT